MHKFICTTEQHKFIIPAHDAHPDQMVPCRCGGALEFAGVLRERKAAELAA